MFEYWFLLRSQKIQVRMPCGCKGILPHMSFYHLTCVKQIFRHNDRHIVPCECNMFSAFLEVVFLRRHWTCAFAACAAASNYPGKDHHFPHYPFRDLYVMMVSLSIQGHESLWRSPLHSVLVSGLANCFNTGWSLFELAWTQWKQRFVPFLLLSSWKAKIGQRFLRNPTNKKIRAIDRQHLFRLEGLLQQCI
jgi:hypothetical protein